MKLTKLHLIIILALTLILCPILGVCNNTREYFQQEETSYGQLGGNNHSEGFKEAVEEGFEEFEGFKEAVEEGFEEEEEEGFEGLALEEGLYVGNQEGLSGNHHQHQLM